MPDLSEPDHEIFPKQFAVNEPISPLPTDLCIVCPHIREVHESRGDYFEQCWCKECNKEEMAGPCSYYFIARHKFKAKIIILPECVVCELSEDSDAHKMTLIIYCTACNEPVNVTNGVLEAMAHTNITGHNNWTHIKPT